MLAGLLLVGAEGGSCVAYRMLNSHGFSYAELQQKRGLLSGELEAFSVLSQEQQTEWQRSHVLHPFLGYVRHPTEADTESRLGVTEFGFIDAQVPLLKRNPKHFIVGLFGGSVATFLFADAGDRLRERLSTMPGVAGRKVELLNLSLPGYKQPQQLMALTYLQSLGAEFDLVLNLDGFNEVSMHQFQQRQVPYPPYPKKWFAMTQAGTDPELLPFMARITYLRDGRRQWAAAFQGMLGRSVSANLLWSVRDQQLARDLAEAQQHMADYEPDAAPYESIGPRWKAETPEETFEFLVDLWRRSSEQMQALCTAQDTLYLHFLQPNQYVPDSKPMGTEEQSVAVLEQHPYRFSVQQGYPLLQAEGAGLQLAEVAFHDLTQVFREVQEPIYIDTCCHINPRGSTLVAEAMADHIQQALQARESR